MELIATDDVNACMKCNKPAMSLSRSATTGVSREEALPPRARIWWLWWGLGRGPWRGLWQGGAATNRRRGAGGTKVVQAVVWMGRTGKEGDKNKILCRMCGYAISFSALSYTDAEEDGKPFPFQEWKEMWAALDGRRVAMDEWVALNGRCTLGRQYESK